jgi:hypothetical protein
VEALDWSGEQDRIRAEQGFVAAKRQGRNISYEHIDDLSRCDMRARAAAEWAEVAWLNQRVWRVERRAPASLLPRLNFSESICLTSLGQ